MIGLKSLWRPRIVRLSSERSLVLEDLPGPKHSLAELQTVFAELFLRRKPFGVRSEISS